MTIRNSENIVAFNRSSVRADVGELPTGGAERLSGINGLALVIDFPARRRVAAVIEFPQPRRTGFCQSLAIKVNESGASRSGWPKRIAIGQDADRKPQTQKTGFQRAADDRQAIERGEDEGMTVGPV